MYLRLAMGVEAREKWRCNSAFPNRGSAASSRSVGSKASSLPKRPATGVSRGSRMRRGCWPSWTSSPTSTCVSCRWRPPKNLAGKSPT